VRIAVVADIHGNLSALEAIIADLRNTAPDVVFHAGDLAANGYRPAEVVDRIRELGWEGVCGNTDEMLWKPELEEQLLRKSPSLGRLWEILFRAMVPATLEKLGDERIEWLRSLPTVLQRDELSIVHAAPRDLWRAPLANGSDAELESTYKELGAKTVVYGHIHAAFARTLPGFTVANTGAASLSYDGDPRASYVLVENGVATHRRVEYDIQKEAAGLRASGFPSATWIASILCTGRYSNPPAES
jgi:putative phosphoesterase